MKRRWQVVVLLALVSVLAFSAPILAAGAKYKGFERGEALITPAQLKALMDAKDPDLVLIGVVKGGLTGSFTRGHIPGAYSVWRPDYTAEDIGHPYPFGGMMMPPLKFQEFARSLGIDNDSKVVIYDEKYDATRLWWSFFLVGKEDVQVLDGGYNGWKAAGYPTEMGFGSKKGTKTGNFTVKARRPGWTWSMEDIWLAKEDPNIQVWDTRESDEWDGTKLKSGAFRKGRIGWAKFFSWKEFRKKVDGTPTEFKTAAEIQKVLDKHGVDPNKDQVFYCQSGVRTTTHLFSLYLMGWPLEKLHNYDGSWIEWSYYKENPIVVEKK